MLGIQVPIAGQNYDRTIRLRAMGVSGDSTVLVTQAFQQVLDSLHKLGGGVLLLDSGHFLTGSIRLRSNTFVEVGTTARWIGSTRLEDYTLGSLLRADSVSNAGIIGQGEINGNGDSFYSNEFLPLPRPEPWLAFHHCSNLTIRGVQLFNSPSHTLAIHNGQSVALAELRITNPIRSPNTDGIDLYDSKDVTISRCTISTGDDAICLKSKQGEMRNIHVEYCLLESDDAAWKIGTGSKGVIRNCSMKHSTIRNSRYGIAVFMLEGGLAEHISFTDLSIHTASRHAVEYPIFLDIDRKRAGDSWGAIRSFRFENIRIETSGKVLMGGQPGAYLEDIVLDSVEMKVIKPVDFTGQKKPRGNKLFPLLPGSVDYAPIQASITLAHAKNVQFNRLSIGSHQPKAERQTFYFQDVEGIKLNWSKESTLRQSHTFEAVQSKNILVNQFAGTGRFKVKFSDDMPDVSGAPLLKIVQPKPSH